LTLDLPSITDGEQAKLSFDIYPIHGCANIASGGVIIPFADGHTCQLPSLTSGPLRYAIYASSYLRRPPTDNDAYKKAVISASAFSLLYPADGIASYPRVEFLED
jgi:5-methyltetrahydropteroyltriglutamate--homocysteine methyltransferase